MNENATLKDVARRAGVSIATVSRVLNGASNVSAQVQQRVSEAIDELGYYQNSIARSLKTRSTFTIAFVTFDISNSYTIMVAKAVEDLVREKKYNLLVCSTEGDPEREREYLKMLLGRNVDALVLHGTGQNGDCIEQISRKIPVVLLHRRYSISGCDLVDSSNEEGMYELTKHLLLFGHRKIFLIKGDANTSTGSERFHGVCRAMQECGVDFGQNYPFQYDGDFTEESGYQAINYLCTLKERPTAILAFNNSMALGALECLKRKHLTAPEDISIASFNAIDHKNLMTVRPTVYSIDPKEVGMAVGRALLERLESENHEITTREFIVQGILVPGNAVNIPPVD